MEIDPDRSKAQLIRPSVSAVILQDGRLLLAQRTDSGQWNLPSGSVEIGETVTAALEREVRLVVPHRQRIRDALDVQPAPFIR